MALTTARINQDILDAHLRKKIEPIYRKSVFMGVLKARGRILYAPRQYIGKTLKWSPRFKRRELIGNSAAVTQITFPITNTRRTAELPWRSYYLGEGVAKIEELLSQNAETAIFRILQTAADEAADDFVTGFGEKIYANGNATGSTDIHGLESLFSVSGPLANGMVGEPNGVYAGLSQVLGYYGGSWTPAANNAWPTGTGDPEYCAWSPLVWDAKSPSFSAPVHNWANQWREVIGTAVTYGSVLRNTTYDVLLVAPNWLQTMKNTLSDKVLFTTTADSELTRLGFKTLQWEGVEITTEYGIPDSVAYFINFDSMALISLQKQLVATDQDTDLATSTRRLRFDFYGNLMFESMNGVAKIANIS